MVDDEWGRRMARARRARRDHRAATDGGAARRRAGAPRRRHRRQDRSTARPGSARSVRGSTSWPAAGIPGRYNVANALLALAILDAMGVAAEIAAPGGGGGDGARADGTHRRRPAVPRDRRLQPQAGRGRRRTGGAAPADPRPADRRAGLRRRPRPGQAADDGRGGRRAAPTSSSSPTTTRARRIRPAIRAADARRGARGAARSQRGEVHEVAGRAEAIAAAVAAAGPATRCWSPARGTRPARRSPASCIPSTTGSSCGAPSSTRPGADDRAHPGRGGGDRRRPAGRRRRPGDVGHRRASSSTRARSSRAGCSSRCRANTTTATTSPSRADRGRGGRGRSRPVRSTVAEHRGRRRR